MENFKISVKINVSDLEVGHDVLGGHSVSPRRTKETIQTAQVSYTHRNLMSKEAFASFWKESQATTQPFVSPARSSVSAFFCVHVLFLS